MGFETSVISSHGKYQGTEVENRSKQESLTKSYSVLLKPFLSAIRATVNILDHSSQLKISSEG